MEIHIESISSKLRLNVSNENVLNNKENHKDIGILSFVFPSHDSAAKRAMDTFS